MEVWIDLYFDASMDGLIFLWNYTWIDILIEVWMELYFDTSMDRLIFYGITDGSMYGLIFDGSMNVYLNEVWFDL